MLVLLVAGVLAKDPAPPTLRMQTTTGNVRTAAGPGLGQPCITLPFTMKLDPSSQRFFIQVSYLWENIQAVVKDGIATISIGGDCTSDYVDDFPLTEDLFYESSYAGPAMISTSFFQNITTNHFHGEFDIDFSYYYYYYYYYYYSSYYYDSIFKREAAEDAAEDAAEEAELEELAKVARSAAEAEGLPTPSTAAYDLYAMADNPDFIARWILYSMPGVPGTVIDYMSYDYRTLYDSDFLPYCTSHRRLHEERAARAEAEEEEQEPAEGHLFRVVAEKLELLSQTAAEDDLADQLNAMEQEELQEELLSSQHERATC